MPELIIGRRDDWPTLGDQIMDWLEAYLCHGPGDIQGSSWVDFPLDGEEVRLIRDLYRVTPPGFDRNGNRDDSPGGRRVIDEATYSRSKGRRKSEIAGALAVLEALGPVRFDGWNSSGEPVGRPVQSPFVKCLATEEGQAGNTFGNVVVMCDHIVDKSPEIAPGLNVAMTRVLLGAEGEIRQCSAAGASKDGGKETFVVADEVHLWFLNELRNMYQVVSRNLAKRKLAEPWMLNTTTAHRPGQGSIGEDLHTQARKIVENNTPSRGFYFNHRAATLPDNWDDDDEMVAKLYEAYGAASEWMDFERMLTKVRDPKGTPEDAARYFLNAVLPAGESAFDVDLFRSLSRPDLVLADKTPVALGFDGARVQDSTGLIATDLATGHQQVVGYWYRPENAPRDWEVDEDEVDDAVASAFDRFEVVRMYPDPPYWESTIAKWRNRYGDKRVVPWQTYRDRPMCMAIRSYRVAMETNVKTDVDNVTSGTITNDGHSAFIAHIGNCRRKDNLRIRDENDRPLFTVRKERPDSPNKIDLAMAAILSNECRNDVLASGWKPRRRGGGAVYGF